MSSVPRQDRSVEQYFVEKVPCQNILPRYDRAPLTFQLEGRNDQMIDLKVFVIPDVRPFYATFL